jgi:hypothetical protein
MGGGGQIPMQLLMQLMQGGGGGAPMQGGMTDPNMR